MSDLRTMRGGQEIEREAGLAAIADEVRGWIKWTEREHSKATDDTHVMLNGYENAPPFWPHIGTLKNWLAVLAPAQSDGSLKGQDPQGLDPKDESGVGNADAPKS